MSLVTVFLLIIIGLLAGFIGGLIGVGGGIIIIPLLILLLEMTQHQAQGTALFTMLPPIGILAAINYYKQGAVSYTHLTLPTIYSV